MGSSCARTSRVLGRLTQEDPLWSGRETGTIDPGRRFSPTNGNTGARYGPRCPSLASRRTDPRSGVDVGAGLAALPAGPPRRTPCGVGAPLANDTYRSQ